MERWLTRDDMKVMSKGGSYEIIDTHLQESIVACSLLGSYTRFGNHTYYVTAPEFIEPTASECYDTFSCPKDEMYHHISNGWWPTNLGPDLGTKYLIMRKECPVLLATFGWWSKEHFDWYPIPS